MKKLLLTGLSIITASMLLVGCGEEKETTTDTQLITIYDSNLKETNKLAPLETMFVKIAGVAPNELHRIEVLDPDLKTISQAEVRSNADGVISPMPIWYDIGLEKQDDGSFSITKRDLSLKAFYIKITSLENSGTNFKQDFFLLLKKPTSADDMPKPIITSVSLEDGIHDKINNTFFETGSKNPDGSDSNLTKVYVKADQLPYHTIKDGKIVNTDKVDIYVVPFSGVPFDNEMDLENIAITSVKNVATDDNTTFRSLKPTLIWDLNKDPKLINPGDSNNAYSIIIDTNQNGKFDIGEDLDGDGKYDRYIDGVDGQGVAGFIVLDTEANSLDYTITDIDKNGINSITEEASGDTTALYLNMKNIPTKNNDAKIYVIDKDAAQLEDGLDLNSNEVRNSNPDGSKGTNATILQPDNTTTFMPYIELSKIITTQDISSYGYPTDISTQKNLDIVVDINKNGIFESGIDYYLPNAISILPYDPIVTTTTDQDGLNVTSVFNEANSNADTTVYIKYGDDNSGNCIDTSYAYFYKADTNIVSNQTLPTPITKDLIHTNNNCITKFIDSTELAENNIIKIINPTQNNNRYFIIIDQNNNNIFDDEDKKIEIAFKDTSANNLPNVSYINLASGGNFGQPYEHWVNSPYTKVYDYRDTFDTQASNTVPPEFPFVSPGIKVVWNPYIKDTGWWITTEGKYIDEKGVENPSPLNVNQMVDLYIIDANKYKLYKDMTLSDTMDIRGRHLTLPTQFSCRNGVNLQTIWSAPLTVGKYYVIVDMNRNGKVDDGIDLIDAVKQDGSTIKDDPNIVGFSVVE